MIPDTMELAGRRRMINEIREKQAVIDQKRIKLYEAIRGLNKQDNAYTEEIYVLERSVVQANAANLLWLVQVSHVGDSYLVNTNVRYVVYGRVTNALLS